MLKLTFLGTSAGLPTKERNVTGLAVECVNTLLAGDHQASKAKRPWVLIDCGEGTQHQLLHTRLSLMNLAMIAITHVHGDHCYGLPGLLASCAMMGRTAPLTLIAPQAIAKLLDTLTLTTELSFDFAIEFIATETLMAEQGGRYSLPFSPSHALQIELVPLSHRTPCHGFLLTQQLQGQVLNTAKLLQEGVAPSPVWGRLKRGETVLLSDGRTLESSDYVQSEEQQVQVLVAGDNDTPECLGEAVARVDVLVHEATYTEAVQARIMARVQAGEQLNPQHSTAKAVAQFAQAVQLPAVILSHFSARYASKDDPDSDTPNIGHLRVEAEAHYQGKLWLAQDFAQFEVGEGVVQVT